MFLKEMFIKALKKNNVQFVNNILNKYPYLIKYCDRELFFLLVKNNNVDLIKKLFENGLWYNRCSSEIFEYAIIQGFDEIVEELLVRGLNPNKCNSKTFEIAIKNKFIKITTLLLNNGIYVKKCSLDVFINAIVDDSKEIIWNLIIRGFLNIKINRFNRYFGLLSMIIKYYPEFSIYLINNGHPKIFEIAVKSNAIIALDLLITNNFSPNECSCSAFIDALKNNSYETIKILIDNNYSLFENLSFEELEKISMKYNSYGIVDMILETGLYDVNEFSKKTLNNLTIYNNYLTFEIMIKNGFLVHKYPKELYDVALEQDFGNRIIELLQYNNYVYKMDLVSMKNNALIPFIHFIKSNKLNIGVMKMILTFYFGYNFPKCLVEKFVFYNFK
jgi:hypothetical protein